MRIQPLRMVLVAVLCAGSSFAAQAPWDLPPLRYSESQAHDPFAKLMVEVQAGRVSLPEQDAKTLLVALLKHLQVPVESQVLVFSKTSKQVQLIGPQTPRAIYFSDNTYVAWVPGGHIEIIAHDAKLGPVFYEINPTYRGGKLDYKRSGSCLACHLPSDGEGALGLTLRSVETKPSGLPVSVVAPEVDGRTPYKDRWGGWYVTGREEGLTHLGNMAQGTLLDLEEQVPAGRYPQRGSDIVAHMVLDHQARLYSLFTKASMHYRRAIWLEQALAKKGGSPPGAENQASARIASKAVEEILASLLFCDEAKMVGDGVVGSKEFQAAFQASARKVGPKQRSLKDLRIYGYLFKNRCSYMVHSDGFRDLPSGVKSLLLERLKQILDGKDLSGRFEHLGKRERTRIAAILKETIGL